MDQARLIVDPPASGAWNMSVDQAILETANETGLVTLRFYSWSDPTLSLGYFQSHEDRRLHHPSLECPLVRRRTGGGAIIHDHEITYSLCIPSTNRWSTKNSELYQLVHRAIVDLLAEQGIEASLHCESERSGDRDENGSNVAQHAFMCFQRRAPGDIVFNGNKIAGSAQRRLKNAVLQHGSILLKKSKFSPELPGITDLCSARLKESDLIEKLAYSIGNPLRVDSVYGMLTTPENSAARRAYSSYFDCKTWNLRR